MKPFNRFFLVVVSISSASVSCGSAQVDRVVYEPRPVNEITRVLDNLGDAQNRFDVALPNRNGANLSSSKVVDGSIVLVTVHDSRLGLDPSSVKGEFKGIQFPFYSLEKEGYFRAVLGVPFDLSAGTFPVVVRVNAEGGEKTHELPLQVIAGNYRSETLRVNPKLVKPPKKYLPRIRKEGREITAVYKTLSTERLWEGPFQLPVKSLVTSPFGTHRMYNGEKRGFHKGVDLRAATGTPIRAPAGGIVRLAKSTYFSGNLVMLDHGYGLITLYAHLSKIRVKKGARVKTGQIVGLAGETGRVNGPHLHWGAVIHNKKVNPLELTRALQ